jgi:hypothetical protein
MGTLLHPQPLLVLPQGPCATHLLLRLTERLHTLVRRWTRAC